MDGVVDGSVDDPLVQVGVDSGVDGGMDGGMEGALDDELAHSQDGDVDMADERLIQLNRQVFCLAFSCLCV